MLPETILAVMGDIAASELPEDRPGNPPVDDDQAAYVVLTVGAVRSVRRFLRGFLFRGAK